MHKNAVELSGKLYPVNFRIFIVYIFLNDYPVQREG